MCAQYAEKRDQTMAKRDLKNELLGYKSLVAPNLPNPETEYRFHPVRRWRLDLAWPRYKVGVECHGQIWRSGRHTRGGGFKNDREKMNEAALHGWLVLELVADWIDDDPNWCWDKILEALLLRGL